MHNIGVMMRRRVAGLAVLAAGLAVGSGTGAAAEPARPETPGSLTPGSVSVCYVPWWMNHRLPNSFCSDLPLRPVNPAVTPKWLELSLDRTVADMQRAGVDVVGWDTFGTPQIEQLPPFLEACRRQKSALKVAPYLDINGRADVKVAAGSFRDSLAQFEKMPLFTDYRYGRNVYTWATRDLAAAQWDEVFDALRTAGMKDGYNWIAHLQSYLDQAKTDAYMRGYVKPAAFAAAYRWDPRGLDEVARIEENFGRAVKAAGGQYIGTVLPMYRRAGYGLFYVEGEGYQLFRKTWEASLAGRPSEVHVVTWNDYDEASLVEPSLNRGYCLTDLNAYYSALFKTGKAIPDHTRLFIAYPRGRTDRDEAYVDVTGLYRPEDLPVRLELSLVNDQGRTVKVFPRREIALPGIQSAVFNYVASQDLGLNVRPVVTVSSGKSGLKREFGPALPWMSIYDLGPNRDRLMWMAEVTAAPALTVNLTAANPSADYSGGFLKKPAILTVTVKGGTAAHLVLMRNNEHAAIVMDGACYQPGGAFGGDWGWEKYGTATVERQPDGSVRYTFPEPPCTYAFSKGEWAQPHPGRTATGLARDWYAAVAVTAAGERAFTAPVVVARGAPDPTVLRLSTLTPLNAKSLADDSGKGYDLVTAQPPFPPVEERHGMKMLPLLPGHDYYLPNETLSIPSFQIEFSLVEVKRAPVMILKQESAECELFIDADNRLCARRGVGEAVAGVSYAVVRSRQPLPLDTLVRVKVVVAPRSGLALFLDGKLQGREPLRPRDRTTGAGLRMGVPLDGAAAAYECRIGDFLITALLP
ncbi:MAG: hypothetical protein WC708_05600 [Lentisphaeria bacterium]